MMMRVAMGLMVLLAFGLADRVAAQDAKVQQGMKLFEAQKCGICHAVAGKGNKNNPLDGVGKKLTEAQIKEWIVDPAAAAKKANSTAKPPMRAFASLPAADIDALVAYM